MTIKTEAGPPAAPKDDKLVGVETPHFVQGMGLFSATAIVMGSMIGSGIFIVSADMSRTLGSPALLIAAWLVTAVMTIIGALSYGELAAMMPKAGGQYVYLREALGPLWGFLYGWTLFLVIQTGTIAAVGVGFGKFLGVFFPAISTKNWILHIGSGNIGLSTANLVAILIITLLTFANTRGVKLGAAVQNVFTSAKILALAAVVLVGVLAKNAVAVSANFGHNFWALGFLKLRGVLNGHTYIGDGPWPHATQWELMFNIVGALAVVQVGSLFSADAWNNVTFTAGEIKNPKRNLPLSLALGTGVVLAAVPALQLRLPERAAAGWRSECGYDCGSGNSVRGGGPGGDGGDGGRLRQSGFEADGRSDPDFDVRMRERDAAGGGPGVLRDEPGRAVLQGCGQAEPEVECAGELAVGAVGVDVSAVCFGELRATAGLRGVRGADLLHPDDWRAVRAAQDASRCSETV